MHIDLSPKHRSVTMQCQIMYAVESPKEAMVSITTDAIADALLANNVAKYTNLMLLVQCLKMICV
jgi:hypothetical protein